MSAESPNPAPISNNGGEPTVVVRFRVPGQMAQLRSGDLELKRHDTVIVESERGPIPATVLMAPEMSRSDRSPSSTEHLPRVLRRANDDDLRVIKRTRTREQEAFRFCHERIRALEQPMKLVAVEIAHSGSRAIFYFTSAERVDFRALVKDLARRFHTRIEMRQIGVRDAARHTGGIGVCGAELCCSTWLPNFKPISIRMAKDQNLALNHDKLSGVCGRLRCCLRYEQENYQEARRGMPKLGKRVITPAGEGRVKDLNILRRIVGVQLADGGYSEFDADSVSRPPQPNQRRAPPKDFERDPSPPSGANQDTRDEHRTEAKTEQPTPQSSAPGRDTASDERTPDRAGDASTPNPTPRKHRRRRGRRGGKKPPSS